LRPGVDLLSTTAEVILSIFLLVLSPLAVGLLLGVDRKLTARMQNRVGPPILQPFYDLLKLTGKRRSLLNSGQVAFALGCLLFQFLALAVLAFGGDLLVVFFLSSAGSVFLALGAFSSRSPFSQLGAQRELLQVLACEPVLFMVIIALGFDQRSFLAGDISTALLPSLLLALIALVPVLVIKLQKSPYDIATAHTELISGPHIEYSGPYLAIVEFAHWLELSVILGIISLFWNDPTLWVSMVGKVALILAVWFVVLLIDNATARLVRKRMVSFTLSFGMTLVALNLVLLQYVPPEVGI
jgi:ech hydrogenase subunit B